MYSLEIEEPKVVKGLSSMQFIVKRWKEIAIADDEAALSEYAEAKFTPCSIKWRISPRPEEAALRTSASST